MASLNSVLEFKLGLKLELVGMVAFLSAHRLLMINLNSNNNHNNLSGLWILLNEILIL